MKQERERILQMVQEGKLSVNEALTLLEELEKSAKTAEKKQEQLVTELSTFVRSGGHKQEKSSYDTFQSTKDKFIDFVDAALKKIKDFDLDLNFGKHFEVSHIFQQNDMTVNCIDCDIANGNVKIIPWSQSDIRVECRAQVYRGDTMEEAKESFLKDTAFDVRGDHLYFLSSEKRIKLEASLYIPQRDYDRLEVKLFNGSIEGNNLSAKTIKMKSANGKITVDGINSLEIDAETVNGPIVLSRCQAGKVEAETLNGAIELKGSAGSLDLQSFNGDIQCQLTDDQCQWIEAKTTTGKMDLGLPKGMNIHGELKSNLGNFNVTLDGIQIIEDKSELIQKNLSFKSIKESSQPLKIHADTKTGSIVIHEA